MQRSGPVGAPRERNRSASLATLLGLLHFVTGTLSADFAGLSGSLENQGTALVTTRRHERTRAEPERNSAFGGCQFMEGAVGLAKVSPCGTWFHVVPPERVPEKRTPFGSTPMFNVEDWRGWAGIRLRQVRRGRLG